MADLEIACAVEGTRYVAHCAAMLASLLRWHPAGTRIHFLHGPDITRRRRDRLAAMVRRAGGEIDFHFVADARVAGLPTEDFTRKATWYRVLLPDLLSDLDRVLYLDSDLLVTDNLLPLWGTDLSGAYLGAVTNVLEPIYAHRPPELGIGDTRDYFNAGVLLMDLDVMRTDGCAAAMLEYGVREAPNLLWRDQDVLNVILGSRRRRLHPRWNAMNILRFPWAADVFSDEELAEALAKPAIRHFEGPEDNKPWHFMAAREHRRLYVDYRRSTPWPLVRSDGLNPANVARKVRRRARAALIRSR